MSQERRGQGAPRPRGRLHTGEEDRKDSGVGRAPGLQGGGGCLGRLDFILNPRRSEGGKRGDQFHLFRLNDLLKACHVLGEVGAVKRRDMGFA